MQETRQKNSTMDILISAHSNFSLIRGVTKVQSSIPAAEQYVMPLTTSIHEADAHAFELEKILKSLLGVDRNRASVIFCWEHTCL